MTQIPVQKAVELLFPHGGLKSATLMTAIRKGNLAYTRLGRAYFVTEVDVQEWVKSCRNVPKVRGSISGSGKGEKPSGLSETDKQKGSLAAVEAAMKRLSELSGPISEKSTPTIPGNVIRPKFKSPTF